MTEDLKKQAQALLAEAERCIQEAGKLAKQGQFVLHFGETGTFIPRNWKNTDQFRAEAQAELEKNGKYVGWNSITREAIYKPYAELDDDEKTSVLEHMLESYLDDCGVPSEYREYGDDEGPDDWWAPSRC